MTIMWLSARLPVAAVLLALAAGCSETPCGAVSGPTLQTAQPAETASDWNLLRKSEDARLYAYIAPDRLAKHVDAVSVLTRANVLTSRGGKVRFTTAAIARSTPGNEEGDGRVFEIGTLAPTKFTSRRNEIPCDESRVPERIYRFEERIATLAPLGKTLADNGLLLAGDPNESLTPRPVEHTVRGTSDAIVREFMIENNGSSTHQLSGERIDFRWSPAWK